MKLMSITLKGYKRFEQRTEIDVAGNVIALVGPNEAGKSSILDAMLSFDRRRTFTPRERTRNSQGGTSVMAGFILDDEDRAALSDIPGGGNVRWWTFELADQDQTFRHAFDLRPAPKRDLSQRHLHAASLRGFAENENLTRFQSVGELIIADLYQKALSALEDEDDNLSDEEQESIQLFARTMFRFSNICGEPDPNSNDQVSPEFCTLLRELTDYSEGDSPHLLAGRILVERMPKFVICSPMIAISGLHMTCLR